MADATFDGAGLIIQLPSIGTFDVERDLYSAWKRWHTLTDNAKFPPAFDTTGGDDVGSGQQIAPYFFLRNDLGWRIRAPQENGEIILQGNLFPRDPGQVTFVDAAGFDAFIRQEVSTRAVVVETGVSGLTASESTQLGLITGIQQLIDELHKINGLDIANPMTVTPTSRTAGDISQTISGDGQNTSTVTRT